MSNTAVLGTLFLKNLTLTQCSFKGIGVYNGAAHLRGFFSFTSRGEGHRMVGDRLYVAVSSRV